MIQRSQSRLAIVAVDAIVSVGPDDADARASAFLSDVAARMPSSLRRAVLCVGAFRRSDRTRAAARLRDLIPHELVRWYEKNLQAEIENARHRQERT